MSKRYAYGLDLSMTCSGIAIFDMDTLEPVLVTSISPSNKGEHGNKLHEQREYMKEIIEQYPPEVCYYEKGFSRFNTATQVVFRVVGVFNELLRDYPLAYFAPTSVKKEITGKGNCSKERLLEVLAERYPEINFSNTDESDAVGVVITGLIKEHKMEWDAPDKPKKK